MRKTKYLFLFVLFALVASPVEAKKKQSEFTKGFNFGKNFLKPKTAKGKKYRQGLVKMWQDYGGFYAKYAKYEIPPMLSRAWLESRGNPWSHTKDTHLMEAGLTSVTYSDAWAVCDEWGVCGDPCGDPELSIAISAYRKYRSHKDMLEGTNADGEDTFWSSWLPQQADDNYFEARCFMGICGSANCYKVKKAVKSADHSANVLTRTGKDGKMHAWWFTINWLKDQNMGKLKWLFEPLPPGISIWRFATKWGRQIAGHEMRAEFFEPNEDGTKNYCWSNRPWYPHEEISVTNDDGTVTTELVPVFPDPINPWTKSTFPKKAHFRKNCVFYGDKKKWKKSWGGPKPNDRWKGTGMRYHPVTGDPINVKKGQKKFPTHDDWQEAYNKWRQDQIDIGRLPTEEETKQAEQILKESGCTFRIPITISNLY